MSLTREQDPAQILVMTADHETRTVTVHQAGITIGSKPDNDIVLSGNEVAGYHARMEREDGHFRVIDLNSPAGTFLGDVRLRPGSPVDWTPELALRIGNNWLGLQLTKNGEPNGNGTTAITPAVTQPVVPIPDYDPELITWSQSKQTGLYLTPVQISITPGKSGQISLILFNNHSETNHFQLAVTGIPANWIAALPSSVAVAPGGKQVADLNLQLPRIPSTRAGRYQVVVKVTSQALPGDVLEASFTLTVLAFSRFTSAINPQTLNPNDRTQVKIENLGNTPETYTVSLEDRSGELTFVVHDGAFRVPEGESATLEVQANTIPRLWTRRGRTYPFFAYVTSSSGETQTLEATVLGAGSPLGWVLPLSIFIGLIMCALSMLLFSDSFGRTLAALANITLTPTATVVTDSDNDGLSDAEELRLGTDPSNVDTDGDILWDGNEIRAGTNPLAVDSDGDTLTDGEEVTILFTSPINADTDSDGLNDNVDPDPGHLPTATPITPTLTFTPIPPTATLTPIPPTLTFTPVPAATTAVPPVVVTNTPGPVTMTGWLVFESQRDGNLEVYLYRGDTGGQLRLTSNTADDRHLVWSPKGNLMAFDSNRDGNSEIYVMNVDGTAQTRLTDNPARDFNPVWSPDGLRLAFLSDRDGNVEIYVINSDGSGLIQLTSNLVEECCPVWSPLGDLISFVSNRDGGWGLYRMKVDGLEQTRLAAASAIPPAWSPDGKRLVYVSDRGGNSDLYSISTDGVGETRLTDNPGQDTNPVWSPNGARIAFFSNRDGNPEIYVMNADGSAQTRLTANAANECCLVWSPDSTQIAFVSDRDGNYEIYVMNVQTGAVTRITNNAAYDAPLAWRP